MPELRTLPLRSLHVRFGARFTEFAGWEMPLWYSGALAEHRAVRTSCGVFDVSHMGRTRVRGPEGARGLATALTRDPARLDVGASAYALACNERGGIIDDLIVYRRRDEELLVISNAANVAAVRAAIESGCSGLDAEVEDVGQGSVLLAVQGRDARHRVAESLGNDVMELPRRRCEDVEVRGESYFLSRTGYTGEDGFEVMTSVEAGGRLLEALVDGGCSPCGLAARDSLRLEAALALHGADIDEATTPWEAGLGWAVEMDHTFVGREALAATEHATERRLACLVADGPGVFRHGCPVYAGDEPVGTLTSGGFSPMLEKSIGMGYLPRALAREGQALAVDVRGRKIPSHVVRRPFYSPARG